MISKYHMFIFKYHQQVGTICLLETDLCAMFSLDMKIVVTVPTQYTELNVQ